MTEFSLEAIRQSGYLREGFADHYDAFRPAPPTVLLDALVRYAGDSPVRCVVDLGSGTGLSTRAWTGRAAEVIGVEANPAMLAVAERRSEANLRYLRAFAHETGLPDASADLVVSSQSFHWMDRVATLREAARILRPGGVFAAYDYDAVPVVHPEVEDAWSEHLMLRARFRNEHRVEAGWTRQQKHEHLDVMRASGHFAYAREFVVHDELEAGAAELIGFARSLGLVPELVALGVSEEELGLTRLEEATRQILGDRTTPMLLGYRVRVGVTPAG